MINNKKFTLLISNIRSYKSKSVGLKGVLHSIRPNLILLSEVNLPKNVKPDLDGYLTYYHKGTQKHMSGISTSIDEKSAPFSVCIKDGGEQEFLITRHAEFNPPINVINYHGEQESHNNVEYIENNWNEIVTELNRIERIGEASILAGDFNKHVGDLIPNNKDKLSPGGRLVKQLIENGRFVLVNATSKAKGGPFTRFETSQPNNDELKSSIDFVIVSKNLEKYIKELRIDSELSFTPFRVVNNQIKYTDHYSLLLEMDIPLNDETNKTRAMKKSKMWNTNKEGSWLKFNEITEKNKQFSTLSKERYLNPTDMYDKLERELNSCKYKAFGKITYRPQLPENKQLQKLINEKKRVLNETNKNPQTGKVICNIDNQIVNSVKSIRKGKLEKEHDLISKT